MAEITPTPRQGVHTTFAAFGTTERFAEITPTPRQGVHTELALFLTTETVREILPTPRQGVHTKFRFPAPFASHHVGLVWQANHG